MLIIEYQVEHRSRYGYIDKPITLCGRFESVDKLKDNYSENSPERYKGWHLINFKILKEEK